MTHRFELSGLSLPGDLTGDTRSGLVGMTVGPWQLVESQDSGLLSFAAGEPHPDPADDILRWCVDVDGDPADAARTLVQGTASVARAERRLEQLSGRMDRVLGLAAERSPEQISFDVDGFAGISGLEEVAGQAPERAILQDMLRLDHDRLALGDQEADTSLVSFDVAAAEDEQDQVRLTGWRRMAEQVEETMTILLRKLLNFSWVETRERKNLVAQTQIGWSGDSRSIVMPAPGPEIAALHVRSVSLAVSTRHTWGQLIATVIQISKLIIKAWANPASLITALPMAWRFAQDVLAEMKA